MKPRTWPELQHPTPDQWLDWLLANDRADRVAIVARVLAHVEDAQACVVQGHDTLRLELAHLDVLLRVSTAQARRYRLAWMSARRFRWRLRTAVAEHFARHDTEETR